MSARAIRRNAQRPASPQAAPVHTRNEASTSRSRDYLTEMLSADIDRMAQQQRAAVNRANALLSTGPVTEAGKRIASSNSLKTGLTGRTVLLPSDDVVAYQAHLARFEAQYQPATEAECEHVQTLADTRWRLNRIPLLEAGIFLRGRLQCADKYSAHEPAIAGALVDTETLITYAKQLRALHTQESRLNRTFAKELAALQALQAARREAEQEAQAPAATVPATALIAAAVAAAPATLPSLLTAQTPQNHQEQLANR